MTVEEQREEADSRSAELTKQLQDEVGEKECLLTSCDDLRDTVKRTEAEKNELKRLLLETKAKISGKSKLYAVISRVNRFPT